VSPTVNISINGTAVSSHGTVWYHCGTLIFSCSVSGYHDILDIGAGTYPISYLFPATSVASGASVTVYEGDLETTGDAGDCFQASAAGTGSEGSSQRVTSGSPCIASPPGCTGCGCNGTICEQSESCPLILDLNGDGIHTTGLDDPVHFWIDLQGRTETTAWTDPHTEEAFLWTDLNDDHVAQVTELFGSRMIAPGGQYHANGFEALLKYDRPEFGGNGDWQITHKDRLWPQLKLWVDRNHDAVSQRRELSRLEEHGIVALNLGYSDGHDYDANGNELYLVSSYAARVRGTRGNGTELRALADVEFKYIPNE